MSKKHNGNVLIIDGYSIERASMKALLAGEKKVGEIYGASDLGEAEDQLKKNNFSLVIFSLKSMDQEEVSFLKQVKQLADDQPIMVLGPDNNHHNMIRVMKMGAQSYVTKNEKKDVVLNGIAALLDGKEFFPGLKGTVLKPEISSSKKGSSTITSREKEILQLVVSGLNNTSISKQLKISVRTVENHRANMMRKLNVKNTAELVKVAITEDLVDH